MRGFDKVGFLLLAFALLAIASPAFAQCRGGSCGTRKPAAKPVQRAAWYPGQLLGFKRGR